MILNISAWAAAFAVGAAIGALYFMLLWLAVRALTSRSWSPPFHMFVFYLQVLVRIALIIGGLLLAIVLEAPVGEIGSALVGFLLARFMVNSVVRRQGREDS